MATWKCPKCGYVNVFDNQEYCSSCGNKKGLPAEDLERLKRAQNVIITTTPTLEGFKITEYFGIISSVIVIGTSLMLEMETYYKKQLGDATKAILEELADKATSKSPEVNALLGLKLDYTVGAKNMMILCGTATAVRYEKLKE